MSHAVMNFPYEPNASDRGRARARNRATGVTVARGFRAGGVHCGLRRRRDDLALLVSDRDAVAAGVFTTNRVQAAPVLTTRAHLAENPDAIRAVIVNSANANACTGPHGDEAARKMAVAAGSALGVAPEQVVVSSTGVIGVPLPVERIESAVPGLVDRLSRDGGYDAAEAIRTTDTFSKEAATTFVAQNGIRVAVGGMAKGSGMIHPNMATTLGFVATDAAISAERLDAMLRGAVERTFNRITVDGDTSTNDMVVVLANGASGVDVELDEHDLAAFEAALGRVLLDLAKEVARDGEGASKLVEVEVSGAVDEPEAVAVARAIAGSSLVKTAVHGADANWGRIVAAAGRAGVDVEPERFALSMCGVPLVDPGWTIRDTEDEIQARMRARSEIELRLDLGRGDAKATTWTCDLTADYVKINASYRT